MKSNFENYLEHKSYSTHTIKQYSRYLREFLSWINEDNLIIEDCSYNDLLSFIDSRKQKAESVGLINRKLIAIRHYYSYLQQEDKKLQNPASNLHLRGTRKRIVSGTISFEKLEKLYKNYSTNTNRDKRNKVILGLLIYQALTTEELQKLKVDNVKLKDGKIEVPGSKRSNSRKLYLQAFQILELQEYIKRVRPKLRATRTDQLILSIKGNREIKNSLLHMFKALRKDSPDIKNAKQIRQSIIVHWLKTFNLREVQYMAGHKYVSSTERYQMDSIEDLQKEVGKYHPLAAVVEDAGGL